MIAAVAAPLVLLPVRAAAIEGEDPSLRHARFRPTQTYYLYVPQAYRLGGNDAWPLFVALHGSMTSGVGDFNLWKQYADQEGFILVAPNFPDQESVSIEQIDRRFVSIIEDVARDYRIDWHRILLSGFSWGGEFAYRFAMSYPRFAHSVAILCAASLPELVRPLAEVRPRFYLAAGGEDPQAVAQTRQVVAALKRSGYRAELYVARGVGSGAIPSKSVIDVLRLVREMKAGV